MLDSCNICGGVTCVGVGDWVAVKAWLVRGGEEGGELENVQTFSKTGSPPLASLQITQLRHHHHHPRVISTPWWVDVDLHRVLWDCSLLNH